MLLRMVKGILVELCLCFGWCFWVRHLERTEAKFVSCKNLKESQILPNWYFVALFFNSVTLLILAIRRDFALGI